MNIKAQLYKLNIFSLYVYLVSFLMISEVIVEKLNEQYDWIIRKQVLNLLPESTHHAYLNLQFFLLLFSLINIFVLPIIGLALVITKKNLLAIIASVTASFTYFLLLRELGDGII